ncbi:MAG: ATP-binding protein, partial [Bdellovibrionota bacterium]
PLVAEQVRQALEKSNGLPVLFPTAQGALAGLRLGRDRMILFWLDWFFFASDFDPARALSVALVSEEGVQFSPSGGESVSAATLVQMAGDLLKNSGQLVIAKRDFRVLAALAPIPGVRGALVLVHVPATEVLALATQALRGSLPFVVGVAFFAVFLGFAFSRQIVRPIEELTDATARIAEGNWAVHLQDTSVQRRDELGTLVAAFQKMGVELASREMALKKASEELLRSEKLATLGQFSAGVAHEVKNPLNVILGYAQLIQMKNSWNEESAKYLGFIMDETRRASRIITELLTFARQKAPILEKMPARALVDRALELIGPQAERAGVRLSAEIMDPDVQVEADRDQIYQVLLNLVTNSIQALEEGTEPREKQVRITLRRQDARVAIEVRDTGPGIPPENLSRLFEPFFSTKGVGKGTGLGLSLCHGIVEQHRGRIEVESELGVGTVFRVLLPRSEA